MDTTIKVTNETKKRINQLSLSEKNKTYDAIINELITYHQKNEKQYKKEHKNWQKHNKKYLNDYKKHEKEMIKHEKEKAVWDKLLIWAKTKGFKPQG
jgi:uncharacterized membrane protein